MKRSFIKDCLLFKSKEPLHNFLGVYVWFSIIQLLIIIINN